MRYLSILIVICTLVGRTNAANDSTKMRRTNAKLNLEKCYGFGYGVHQVSQLEYVKEKSSYLDETLSNLKSEPAYNFLASFGLKKAMKKGWSLVGEGQLGFRKQNISFTQVSTKYISNTTNIGDIRTLNILLGTEYALKKSKFEYKASALIGLSHIYSNFQKGDYQEFIYADLNRTFSTPMYQINVGLERQTKKTFDIGLDCFAQLQPYGRYSVVGYQPTEKHIGGNSSMLGLRLYVAFGSKDK